MEWRNECKCIKCGGTFKSRSSVARFCSDLCGKQYRKATGEKTRVFTSTVTYAKQCVECQSTFISKNSNATRCSDKCRRDGFKKRNPELKAVYSKKYRDRISVESGVVPGVVRQFLTELKCVQCERMFESRVSTAHYCSHKCRMAFHKEHPDTPLKKVVRVRHEKVCEECGEPFVAKTKAATVCSDACKTQQWRTRNPEKAKAVDRAQRIKHRVRIRIQATRHIRERYHADPKFRLRRVLGNRLRQLIRRRKMDQKHGSTLSLVGCSWPFLRDYLASMFRTGMTWDNYGEVWQIDHRKPVTGFNLFIAEEQKQCFHFTNLQPLFTEENNVKRDSDMPPDLYLRTGHKIPSPISLDTMPA